jgi:formylglycine-generating enzyme required for sulfatase activity
MEKKHMFEAGQQLGKYEIIRKLGAGGMADVFLALDTTLQRQVALKILPPEFARDAERAARFEKEVLHCASLQHPGIVTIHDVGHEQGIHFYSMALLSGGDLKQRIQAGLKPKQTLQLLAQIVEALGYAHQQGFVHRDLKPDNIMFDEHDKPVITDFGIAKAISSGTRMTGTGMSIGTPHYMSPEQARGQQVDGRSDLYALGVVLYEMLTGQVPYQADDTFAVGLMHISDPLPQLPKDLAKIQPLLNRLLAKDSAARYRDANALIVDIEKLLQGESLPVAAAADTQRSQRSAQTQVMPVEPAVEKTGSGVKWALVGALLAVIVAGGLWFWQMQSRPQLVQSGGALASGAVTVAPQVAPTKSQPVQPATGGAILQIGSDPDGAKVYLDDRELGQTPLTRSDLPGGEHELVLKKQFYNDASLNLTLEDGIVVKENVELQRGQGRITILTQPQGATVYLDDRKQQEVTPTTLSSVSAGEHSIRVHVDRYYDQEQAVALEPGATSKLDVSLQGGNLVKYNKRWVEPEEAARLKAAAAAEAKRIAAAEAQRKAEVEAKRKAEVKRKAIAAAKSQPESAAVRGDLVSLESAIAQSSALGSPLANMSELRAAAAAAARIAPFSDSATGMEFVYVKGGCYEMGDTFGDGGSDEKPVHDVCVDDFHMGKYEVTQAEWQALMGSNPSTFKGSNRSVEQVSWNDAQSFIGKLSQRSGKNYRLPTEAEWEYAARSGGKQEKYAGSSSAGSVAWYADNSGKKTHSVGQKAANGLGLYDMSGNVYEWCSDWYGKSYYSQSSHSNPQGPSSGSYRVFRGGSWGNSPTGVRVANRSSLGVASRFDFLGFRLVSSER